MDGGHFDPINANAEALAQAMHSLAKKWAQTIRAFSLELESLWGFRNGRVM